MEKKDVRDEEHADPRAKSSRPTMKPLLRFVSQPPLIG
jgi:hypothetical protein